MSEASERGLNWERKVFKAMRSILRIPIKRDSRSGAGMHKADGRDQFALVPLFVECKDHEKLNIKADWRIADGKASHGQAPIVVFPDKEEMLCVIRFTDLLQFIREAWDYRETADSLRSPLTLVKPDAQAMKNMRRQTKKIVDKATADLGKVIEKRVSAGGLTCPNGHITDDYGYCMDKNCKYRRGYKPPKGRG